MKQAHFLLLGLLCTSLLLKAQSNEIGITLSQFYKTHSNENNLYSSTLSQQNNTFYKIGPYITCSHIKKNLTIYSFQYAYVPYKSETNSNSGAESGTTKQNSSSRYTQNTHAIRLGIGKRNNWNQFSFSSMLYIPLEYSSKGTYKSSNSRADSANSTASSTITSTIYPPSFLVGLFISQSINYHITPKLKLGIELNLGIQETFTKGKVLYYTHAEDHGNVVRDQYYTGRENKSQTYFNFIPAACLSYSLR